MPVPPCSEPEASRPAVPSRGVAAWRIWGAGAALAGALLGGWFIHRLGARPPSWYPPCLIHEATGLHCPGCGAARAVHALAQLDVVGALDQNALLIAALPLLAAWAVRETRRFLRGRAFSASLPGGWALGVLIAVLLFTTLRNLPWWPFVLLAPD